MAGIRLINKCEFRTCEYRDEDRYNKLIDW